MRQIQSDSEHFGSDWPQKVQKGDFFRSDSVHLVQIGPKWETSGDFSDQIQYFLAGYKSGDFFRSDSVHFGSVSQSDPLWCQTKYPCLQSTQPM